MTTTQNCIRTTILIPPVGNKTPSTSYDYTSSDHWMPGRLGLESRIDLAIGQWWNSLTASQKSAVCAPKASLKISESYPGKENL